MAADYGFGSRAVALTDLDGAIAGLGLEGRAVAVIKIDVEGFEPAVIAGASRTKLLATTPMNGRKPRPNGNGVYVKFNDADDGCVWNIRISWADGGYPDVMWHDVNLCEISVLTLKYDRATDTTSFESK